MRATAFIGAISLSLIGCTTFSGQSKGDTERGYGASSITVDQRSNARQVLETVPLESAMERFELLDEHGRVISYVAFTDTQVGALVFVDQKLYGTLSPRDAQAFYSCRGYVTAMNKHWAKEAGEWGNSLLQNTTRASSVRLDFSGKSTTQSIKEVVKNNPFLDQLKILVSMGSNPLNIFKTLDRLHDNMLARERYEKTLQGLSVITPGMSELQLADVVMPEEVSFTNGGVVMAYPTHLVEYFVNEGMVKVIQQPSFNYLSRTQVTLFYVANAQWGLCTPSGWKSAFPTLNQETTVAENKKDEPPRKKPNISTGLWNTVTPSMQQVERPAYVAPATARD
jgi:hypothetical protein